MKRNDFQLIGYIGAGLGILLLVGAVATYSLANIYLDPWGGHYDGKLGRAYLDYSMILRVVGIISLVVGLGFLWRAKQEGAPTQTTLPKPPD